MAIKICTVSGCITCNTDQTAKEVTDWIGEKEKGGAKFVCCRSGCVRIDQITTITEYRKLPEDDEDGGRPIFGNPQVVIFTGGQMMLPQRRAPHPEAEPGSHGEEEEPEELQAI